jgi:hypothetical protein
VEGAKAADVTKAVKKYAAQKLPPSRTTSPRADTACEVSPVNKTGFDVARVDPTKHDFFQFYTFCKIFSQNFLNTFV